MSVFKVRLQHITQGLLDFDPSTHPLATGTGSQAATYGQVGEPFGADFPNSGAVSPQRSIFAAGPSKTYRLLTDGETFTDCNYWKQFAFPQVAKEFAFIEVVTDDGSTYSAVSGENSFAAGATETTLNTSYATVAVDLVTTYGGAARFLQLDNLDSTNDATMEINGDAAVELVIVNGTTQSFQRGSLVISSFRLKAASGSPQISWIAGIDSVCNS
jgi:hypothetical protein